MTAGISDLDQLIRLMEPVLHPGVFVFVRVTELAQIPATQLLAMIREQESISAVLAEADAEVLGLTPLFRAAWISLKVHSDLQAVGLTAAFATALGTAGISCNVMAGALHDHIFVPFEHAQRALSVLQALQQDAR